MSMSAYWPRRSEVGDRIAIKSANYMNKYIKMNSNFDIVTQTQVGEWEKFQVVLVEHPLKQFIGQTIGLYNIDWFRFLRMRGSGAGEVDGSPESRTREVMPKDWYDCKFTVVDAGNNKVAFHNHKHSRFLKLESITRSNFAECPPDPNIFPQPTEHTITEIDVRVTDTVDSNAVPASALPSSWTSAMFEVKSPGWGAEASNDDYGPHVALYASGVGRYVRMHGTFCCEHDDAGICMGPASTVGLHDKGSYFKVVGTFHQLVEPYVGRSLALHNAAHNVFLKMENDVITTSPTKAANDFPEGWHSEKFTVVDGRRGLVGLHSPYYNRFVQIEDTEIRGSGSLNSYQLSELSDKLVLTPAGGSTFAIFNPTHGKYLQIDAVGTGCVSYGHRVVIAQSSDAGKNQCGWYGCRVGDMINNKMYFGHGGSTPYGFYFRAPPGSGKSGCISYGDAVVIAYTSNGGNTGCGWYGCRVAAMWGDNSMGFGHGTANPHVFYIRPQPNSGLSGHVQYGHGVIIAYTNSGGHTSNCGWYGCRVASMINNDMIFGHGGANPMPFYLRPIRPISANHLLSASAKFSIVDAFNPMQTLVGLRVGFHNAASNRFLKLHGTAAASPTCDAGAMPDGWQAERFDIVFATNGQVGIKGVYENKYISLQSTGSAVASSNLAAWEWFVLEHFEDGFALKNVHHNKYLEMYNNCCIRGTAGSDGAGKRFSIVKLPGGVDTVPPAVWQKVTNQVCSGEPYTRDQCHLEICNGWSGLTEAGCKAKCENQEVSASCGHRAQRQLCMAASYQPSGGWCQLYSSCGLLQAQSGVHVLRKVDPYGGMSLLQFNTDDDDDIRLDRDDSLLQITDADDDLTELGMALPLALINISTFQTKLAPTNTSNSLDQHLDTLTDLVSGFYAVLHKEMKEDGPLYCPEGNVGLIPMCIALSTCLLQAKVPSKVSMEFYGAMMEQVARFEEVTWETILRALGKEGNLNLDSATIPSKYACDSRDLGNHSLAQPLGAALLQEDSEMERRLIMSRALQRSVESSHRILDSVFWNSSQHQLDSVAEQLDSVWRPICDELGCDSSNYLDVFLTSHRQSAMLLQTNMAAHLRNEIKQRMKLERKVQEVIAGRDAQKFWRPDDYQDASVESFHAYHAKGRAGIEHMLKRARKLGVDKMMLLVNQVDMAFHKRPLEQAFDHEVSNLSLAAVESGDFWDDLAKVFDCIGYGARFTSTGYSYSFNDYVSLALGLSAGDSASLRGLIEMQELTVWASIYAAFAVGACTDIFWVGAQASMTASFGCGYPRLSVTVGFIAAALSKWYSPLVCPFGPTYFGWPNIKCSQAHGFYVTTICCVFDFRTNEHNCR